MSASLSCLHHQENPVFFAHPNGLVVWEKRGKCPPRWIKILWVMGPFSSFGRFSRLNLSSEARIFFWAHLSHFGPSGLDGLFARKSSETKGYFGPTSMKNWHFWTPDEHTENRKNYFFMRPCLHINSPREWKPNSPKTLQRSFFRRKPPTNGIAK